MVQTSTKYCNLLFLLLLHLTNGLDYTFLDEQPNNQQFEDSYSKMENQKFDKRINMISAPAELFKRNFHPAIGTRNMPIYKTTNHGHCSCQLHFKSIDLGIEYYPRYIQTGLCQPNSCERYYQCVERNYKIKVLKRKNIKDNEDAMTSNLPQPLRDFWLAVTVPVGVSCECVMDIQMGMNEV